MLLAKTLRSSTLRLALLYIALFGGALFGLIAWVYFASLPFVQAPAPFALVIRTGLFLGLCLVLVLAAAAGISVTRRTVGRIESINATTREIMERGLDGNARHRIPLRGTRDEWDKLAMNLNAMLDRIETLLREIRQVSDNVAHDLRTPLARVRRRLEKASEEGLDSARDEELVGVTIRDLDDILRTFASLLRISRIEAFDPKSAFRIVDLAGIAGDVAELFEASAEEAGGWIALACDGPIPVFGDRDLLFDALSNLIDNAIKHGGAEVRVEVGQEEGAPFVAVSDRGPGIPAAEWPNVQTRFYRLEPSRSSPGSGLGLSLVAAVANLHGARLDMSDNCPGLRIIMRFSLRS